jgi:hypothetical protein
VGIHQNRCKKKDRKGREALKGWKFVHDHVSQEGWEAMIFLFSM